MHEFYVSSLERYCSKIVRGNRVYNEDEIMRCENCQGFTREKRWCKYLGREAFPEQRSCRSFLRIRQTFEDRQVGQTNKAAEWGCPEGRVRADPSCLSKFCKWMSGTHALCPLLENEGKKLVHLKTVTI